MKNTGYNSLYIAYATFGWQTQHTRNVADDLIIILERIRISKKRYDLGGHTSLKF